MHYQNHLSHCFSSFILRPCTPKKIHQGSNTCTRKRVHGWMWFTSVTVFGCWKFCFSQSREQFYYKRSCVTGSSRILRLEQSDDVLLCFHSPHQDHTGAYSQRDYLNKKDEWTCQPSDPYTGLTPTDSSLSVSTVRSRKTRINISGMRWGEGKEEVGGCRMLFDFQILFSFPRSYTNAGAWAALPLCTTSNFTTTSRAGPHPPLK